MGKVTDFAKKQIGNALDKEAERRNRSAQLYEYICNNEDLLKKNKQFRILFARDIFGEYVDNNELKKILGKLDHEKGDAYVDTNWGRVWLAVDGGAVPSFYFVLDSATSETNDNFSCASEVSSTSNIQENSFNEEDYDDTDQSDDDSMYEMMEAKKLNDIEERPIPSEEDLKTEIKDCTVNAEGTRDEISRAWRTRAIKLISRIKMPEANDFESSIKEIERNANNCNVWEIKKAWTQKKEEIVDYAKDHYADHPSVKPYFDAIDNDNNKINRHNKNVKNKRLIAWGIWLVATIVAFAISEEWYHYLFSGLGTIVLAIVAGILSLFVWEKK